jgi:uncharacterized repeat protein (TIGR03803 family)
MVWQNSVRRTAHAILLSLLGASAFAMPAGAKGLETLYRFSGADGSQPVAALIQGSDGMFYGTTRRGGAADRGTVFKVGPDGTATLLCDFSDPAVGAYPLAGLYRDAKGNLFGTTFGDDNNGTVFEIPADGSGARALHTFSLHDPAGYQPQSQLVGDRRGNLYGTTNSTAFKLRPDGTIKILHVFGQTEGDGEHPAAGVIRDANGNLYGATYSGGANHVGTVYRIAKDGTYSIQHQFGPVDDGIEPWGGLTRDAQGNLYGVAIAGGTMGVGTVFRLAPDGTYTMLHSFTAQDGADPLSSPVLDRRGGLIVTASVGGIVGCGTVIELRKDGTSKILHSFTTVGRRERAGCQPVGGAIVGSDGAIYGTTSFGGQRTSPVGTVYRLEH